jgi:hypothetical protein
VVGHWLHRTLSLAYETWHEHAHTQVRMRGILHRISAQWRLREVAVGFLSWKENSDRQKRAGYITTRVISHWAHRTAAAAFDSWHAHAQDQVGAAAQGGLLLEGCWRRLTHDI